MCAQDTYTLAWKNCLGFSFQRTEFCEKQLSVVEKQLSVVEKREVQGMRDSPVFTFEACLLAVNFIFITASRLGLCLLRFEEGGKKSPRMFCLHVIDVTNDGRPR